MVHLRPLLLASGSNSAFSWRSIAGFFPPPGGKVIVLVCFAHNKWQPEDINLFCVLPSSQGDFLAKSTQRFLVGLKSWGIYCSLNYKLSWLGVVAQAYNPNNLGGRGRTVAETFVSFRM